MLKENKEWNKLTINLTNQERHDLRVLCAYLDKECGPLIREWINEKLKEFNEKSGRL